MDAGITRSIRQAGAGRLPPPLIRAARSGLKLTMLDLARLAGVSIACVHRIEADRGGDGDGPALAGMRRALEAAGAEFVDGEGGPLLRLRSAPPRPRRAGA